VDATPWRQHDDFVFVLKRRITAMRPVYLAYALLVLIILILLVAALVPVDAATLYKVV
jgi:hypothetical protein